jgi:hypothetical protein
LKVEVEETAWNVLAAAPEELEGPSDTDGMEVT